MGKFLNSLRRILIDDGPVEEERKLKTDKDYIDRDMYSAVALLIKSGLLDESSLPFLSALPSAMIAFQSMKRHPEFPDCLDPVICEMGPPAILFAEVLGSTILSRYLANGDIKSFQGKLRSSKDYFALTPEGRHLLMIKDNYKNGN